MVSVMVRWLFELTNIRELKQTTPETTTRTPRHKSLMSRTTAVQVRDKSLDYRTTVANDFYYIDTDEIPGFLLLLKNHIFPAVNISFLSFTCENIGVVMVTNTISQ